jgi:dipeptide/tripeptide permease
MVSKTTGKLELMLCVVAETFLPVAMCSKVRNSCEKLVLVVMVLYVWICIAELCLCAVLI